MSDYEHRSEDEATDAQLEEIRMMAAEIEAGYDGEDHTWTRYSMAIELARERIKARAMSEALTKLEAEIHAMMQELRMVRGA